MFTLPLPWPDASLLLTPPWGSLPPLLHGLLLAALVIVPVALLVTLYRYELRLVTPGTALLLLSLRLLAVLLVLCLVCLQPVFARDRRTELPGQVWIAVDRSSSMDVRDPQRSAADKLRLARLLGLSRDGDSEAWLDRWIEDHEAKREPRLTEPADGSDPAVRQRKQRERQSAHDRLIAAIDGMTRTDLSRQVLSADGLGLLGHVAARHEVKLLGFHRDTREAKTDELDALFAPGSDEAVRAARAFTDLRNPLLRTQEAAVAGQGKVLGIVLLTDGQHNLGVAPNAAARELGQRKVPIYPIAVGEVRSPPDLAVVSVRGPEHSVFKDVEAVVEVRFKVAGTPEGEVLVELHREGKEKKLLATRTLRHDGKDRLYSEAFPLKFDEAGTQTIVATVRPVKPGKETSDDNNRLATTVSVADDRARVLLVDGEARWEHHYLATALQRDRLIDLQRIVFTQPRLDERLSSETREKLGLPAQKWPTGPDALADYQCIILGDVDPAHLPLVERQRLERYVADAGGTLIVVAGKRSMPLGYPAATPSGEPDPLRRLLPIDPARVLAPPSGFALSLTAAGTETRFMELAPDRAENVRLWEGYPRPWGWAVAGTTKPGATALAGWLDPAEAKLPPAEREKHHAVIVRHNFGFGRVLYVGLDSTWRLRYKIGDLYHHRFWGQVIRWAASDKPLVVGNAFVRFGTPQPTYRPGDAIEVIARLSDQLGPIRPNLLAGARVVRLPDAPGTAERAVALAPLERRPAQPRVLETKVTDLPPGRYAVELAIPEMSERLMGPVVDGKGPAPLRATFAVLPPESKETLQLELNRPLLDDLAAASGGQVYTPLDARELEKRLVAQGIPHVEHHEQRLWQWWGFLAIVVVLLTLEWAGRKLAGLP